MLWFEWAALIMQIGFRRKVRDFTETIGKTGFAYRPKVTFVAADCGKFFPRLSMTSTGKQSSSPTHEPR
jgi:hypothetical protein